MDSQSERLSRKRSSRAAQASTSTATSATTSRSTVNPTSSSNAGGLFSIIDNEDEDEGPTFYSLRTRPQNTTKPEKQNVAKPTASATSVSQDLDTGDLGITAKEFDDLHESELKQILEAVVKSKEEYKMKEKKCRLPVDPHDAPLRSRLSKRLNLKCSIPLQQLDVDAKTAVKVPATLSLDSSKCSRLPEENEKKVGKDENHQEKQNISENKQLDEKCLDEAERMFIESNKSGEFDKDAVKNCDSGPVEPRLVLSTTTLGKPPESASYPEDTSLENRSYPTSATVSAAKDDSDAASLNRSVLELSRKVKLAWNDFEYDSDSPPCKLIRKYRVEVEDARPLLRPNGLSRKEHIQVIFNYLMACRQHCYGSARDLNSKWGSPIPIKVEKSHTISNALRSRATINENSENAKNDLSNDELEESSQLQTGKHASDFSKDVNASIFDYVPRKRLKLQGSAEFVEPRSTKSELQSADVQLDGRWKQETVESHPRSSYQTKIGGGLVEEDKQKVAAKKRGPAKRKIESSASNDDLQQMSVGVKKRRQGVAEGKSKQKPRLLDKDVDRGLRHIFSGRRQDEISEEDVMDEVPLDDLAVSAEGHGNVQISKTRQNVNPAACDDICEIRSSESSESSSATNVADCDVENSNAGDQQNSGRYTSFFDDEDAVGETSVREKPRLPVCDVFSTAKPAQQSLRDVQNKDGKSGKGTKTAKTGSTRLTKTECIENAKSSSSEGDGSDWEQDRKKKKTTKPSTATKTGTRRKKKPVTDQQTITSFTTPAIPTEICILCQKKVSKSSYEQHLEECIQQDDRRRNEMETQ